MTPHQEIMSYLDEKGITYDSLSHTAVMTVSESIKNDAHNKSKPTKTLFLTNKKHSKYFLVVMPGLERLDLKSLAVELGESKLSFANSDELSKFLKTYPGAVSPLGAIFINDDNIKIVVDKRVADNNFVGFHPNDNSKTFEFTKKEFQKFLETLNTPTIIL